MTPRATYDLLVVGGGPAGAATAAWAARAGLGVLVVERARFPREKPCAEYVSPAAARELELLGVRAAVERLAQRVEGFRLVSDDGVAAVGRFARLAPDGASRDACGYALPRTKLDPLVLDAARAAGAVVREETACEELVIAGGRVRGAVLRRGAARETVTAEAVVGADGLHSMVARRLGLARAGRPRRLALVAHLAGVEGMGGLGEMFAGDGWYVGLAAVGEDCVNAAMVVDAADAPRLARGAPAYFTAKLRTLPELARRCARARIVRRILVTGPFARRARAATADGALLVGDAADFYDPFTGEGIYAALLGGALAARGLAAALARGPATRAALAPYQRARRAAFAGKWLLERLVAFGSVRPALMRRFTSRSSRRPPVADLWVGAAGGVVPVRALFAPRFLAALL